MCSKQPLAQKPYLGLTQSPASYSHALLLHSCLQTPSPRSSFRPTYALQCFAQYPHNPTSHPDKALENLSMHSPLPKFEAQTQGICKVSSSLPQGSSASQRSKQSLMEKSKVSMPDESESKPQGEILQDRSQNPSPRYVGSTQISGQLLSSHSGSWAPHTVHSPHSHDIIIAIIYQESAPLSTKRSHCLSLNRETVLTSAFVIERQLTLL